VRRVLLLDTAVANASTRHGKAAGSFAPIKRNSSPAYLRIFALRMLLMQLAWCTGSIQTRSSIMVLLRSFRHCEARGRWQRKDPALNKCTKTLVIVHIARGDWWIYSAPDSFEQYKKKAASGPLLLHDCSSELLKIIKCLCYDLHGFVSNTTGGRVTTAAIEAALAPTLGTIDFGAKMPAEFFVASYGCHVDRRAGDPHSQGKTATIAKAVLIKNLHQAELNGP